MDTILETGRLRLRYQRASDVPGLTDLWTDPLATRFLGGPRDREFLVGEFTKTAADPRAEAYDLWPLEERSTGALVGYAGFLPKTVAGTELIELTYLIHPRFWGKGFATEVAQALVGCAGTDLGLETLIAIIEPENGGSRRVAEKVGFTLWTTEERGGTTKEIWRLNRGR